MKESIYSVSQVNIYIKNMFSREAILQQIYVKGEVSNCKYHSSGHIYFTLKDSKGQMTCVMFAGQRSGLSFRMSEGQSVIVLGTISVYERDGKYQMYAKQIMLDGQGALYEQYERQKEKLMELGLFDETLKRPIKRYNKTIGIVTASTGAAIQDIRTISNRRNPYAQLILYPAKVQGDGAKDTIVDGIEYLDQLGVDVIIIGRGGGSIEDLWAFNEEEVAWAIFNCKTPVISAVGHETDTTIADYVADLRAPTPSAAAELAVISIYDLMQSLDNMQYTLNRYMNQKLRMLESNLEKYQIRLSHAEPFYQIRQKRQYLIDVQIKLESIMESNLQRKRHILAIYIERMRGLSPLERLNQGYGFVSDKEGKALRSINAIKAGDNITIDFIDGKVRAIVNRKERIKRMC
ncbi:MAG: exodeoxyribonuclease VII large subunit [Velocimicrobium sp.]